MWQRIQFARFSTENGDPTGNSRTTQFTYDAAFPTLVTQENVIANGTTYTTSIAYDHRFGLPIQVTHPLMGPLNPQFMMAWVALFVSVLPGDATDYNACSSGTAFTLNIHYNLDASPPQIMVERKDISVFCLSTPLCNPGSKTILAQKLIDSHINWVEKSYDYDGFGRVTVETTGGLSASTTYDILGRVLTTGRLDGSTVQTVATYNYAFEAYDLTKKC